MSSTPGVGSSGSQRVRIPSRTPPPTRASTPPPTAAPAPRYPKFHSSVVLGPVEHTMVGPITIVTVRDRKWTYHHWEDMFGLSAGESGVWGGAHNPDLFFVAFAIPSAAEASWRRDAHPATDLPERIVAAMAERGLLCWFPPTPGPGVSMIVKWECAEDVGLFAQVLNTFSIGQMGIHFGACGRNEAAAFATLLRTLDLPAAHTLHLSLRKSPWPQEGSFPDVYAALREFLSGPRSRRLRSIVLPRIHEWWTGGQDPALFRTLQETNTVLEHVCFQGASVCGYEGYRTGGRLYCRICHRTRFGPAAEDIWNGLHALLAKNGQLRYALQRVALRTHVIGQVLLPSQESSPSPPPQGEADSEPQTRRGLSFADLPAEIRRKIVTFAAGAVGVLDTQSLTRVLDHAAERRPIPNFQVDGGSSLTPWEEEGEKRVAVGRWLAAGGFRWAGTPEGALEWMVQQQAEAEPRAMLPAARR